MRDRYGEPPAPVANLFAVARFRLLARAYGLTDVSLQGRHIRFAPAAAAGLASSCGSSGYYPDAVYKAAAEQVSVPRPMTRRVGGEPLRDMALLDWCAELLLVRRCWVRPGTERHTRRPGGRSDVRGSHHEGCGTADRATTGWPADSGACDMTTMRPPWRRVAVADCSSPARPEGALALAGCRSDRRSRVRGRHPLHRRPGDRDRRRGARQVAGAGGRRAGRGRRQRGAGAAAGDRAGGGAPRWSAGTCSRPSPRNAMSARSACGPTRSPSRQGAGRHRVRAAAGGEGRLPAGLCGRRRPPSRPTPTCGRSTTTWSPPAAASTPVVRPVQVEPDRPGQPSWWGERRGARRHLGGGAETGRDDEPAVRAGGAAAWWRSPTSRVACTRCSASR